MVEPGANHKRADSIWARVITEKILGISSMILDTGSNSSELFLELCTINSIDMRIFIRRPHEPYDLCDPCFRVLCMLFLTKFVDVNAKLCPRYPSQNLSMSEFLSSLSFELDLKGWDGHAVGCSVGGRFFLLPSKIQS